ncbi:MAG: hypothetical protein H6670_15120 [Anaerolineaceae bacterium]|nr:hypothetical protein [Anaerolineaceae bacterium]
MFARPIQEEKSSQTIAVVPNKKRGIVAYEGETLPQGNWTITIEAGRAWVFYNNHNVPLHKGETLSLSAADGDIMIRALYANGIAAYEASRN